MEKSTIGILVASGVSAVATLIIAFSTAFFHRWTRKQRSPDPIFIKSEFCFPKSRRGPVAVKTRLANPGEVPIQLRYVVVNLTSQTAETRSYTGKISIPEFIPSRGFEDVQVYIPSDHVPTSPSWDTPCWAYIHLHVEYISGQKLGKVGFHEVARITRFPGDILSAQDYCEFHHTRRRRRWIPKA